MLWILQCLENCIHYNSCVGSHNSEDRKPIPLIINADDFGLTRGVNRSICELYQAGAISSATLMASGEAFEHAVSIAKEHPGLGVGCHVVLLDGRPLSDSVRTRSLSGKQGRLHSSLSSFLARLCVGRIGAEALFDETVTQIHRLQDAGIQPTHVDTHKHTHMFPPVARAVMLAAKECGVHYIRNPFEDPWSVRLMPAPGLRTYQVRLLNHLRNRFLALIQELGMRTSDGSVGIAATGSLDSSSLHSLTYSLREGIWEVVCHPGYNDADLSRVRTRLTESREIERQALLQVVPGAVQSGYIRLGTFDMIKS